MPKDRRTHEQIAERDAKRAAHTAAREERRDERTTEKMQKRSDAYIKHWKNKLEREEERRLKNRDARELDRLEVRASGVAERKQHGKNVAAAKERAWEASREAEREKHRLGDEVVRQIEAAKAENRQKARAIYDK